MSLWNQPILIMPPIRPATPASPDPRSPMAPPYVDEDEDIALVQQGLDEAEDETREAVADAYQTSALDSDDPSESLDDIDFNESEEESTTPELAAMHVEFIPEEDEEE